MSILRGFTCEGAGSGRGGNFRIPERRLKHVERVEKLPHNFSSGGLAAEAHSLLPGGKERRRRKGDKNIKWKGRVRFGARQVYMEAGWAGKRSIPREARPKRTRG